MNSFITWLLSVLVHNSLPIGIFYLTAAQEMMYYKEPSASVLTQTTTNSTDGGHAIGPLTEHMKKCKCVVCCLEQWFSKMTTNHSAQVTLGYCKKCDMVFHIMPLTSNECQKIHQLSKFSNIKTCFAIGHTNIGFQIWK